MLVKLLSVNFESECASSATDWQGGLFLETIANVQAVYDHAGRWTQGFLDPLFELRAGLLPVSSFKRNARPVPTFQAA